MLATLFPEYVKKWFTGIAKKVTETINGSKEAPKYLFTQWLKEEFSIDLKWKSLSSQGTIVAADVVALDSPLPLKKRDKISTAEGDIPKIGMKLQLNETQMQQIDLLNAKGGMEPTVVAKLFADTKKVISGVYERLEFMFLQALSSGVTSIADENNVGVGIRVDFGIPEDNKFGILAKAWSDTDATPLDDIQNVKDKALAKGVNLMYMVLDTPTFSNMRKSTQFKELYAGSIGMPVVTGSKLGVPSKENSLSFILAEYGLTIQLVDRIINTEKNGVKTAQKPWAANQVTFVPSLDLGTLQYGTLVEEGHPVENVVYEKPNSYILLSKYHKNDPVREFTSSQAHVIPVLSDVDSIFMLDTTEGQLVDAAEVEGDANITIWETLLVKADVIAALNDMEITTTATITDAGLIKKINGLSDENEAALKAALGL